MISCDKAKSLLTDYIDGTLEPAIKKEVDAHLNEDPECSKLYSDSIQIYNQLKNLAGIKPAEDFDLRLRNRIIDENNSNEKPALFNKKSMSLAISGTVLTAALYLFIFTDFGVSSNSNENIMPSSTIGSAPSSLTTAENEDVSNTPNSAVEDSVKIAPEKVDNSAIRMAGEEEK